VSWRAYCLGFVAGAVLASYLTLSCASGNAQSEEVASAIHEAATTHGVPEARLRCLAYRESRFFPGAFNRAGPYHGLFQFDWPTWRSGAWRAGWTGWSPYQPLAAAHVAAFLIAHGEGWRWPPLRWC
jgi:Transglycosylase SLT domain